MAGAKLELFLINFVKDKMTLRVPTAGQACRAAGGQARARDAQGPPPHQTHPCRAQEYEAKINSGNIVAIAEVVRDLYRSDAQPEPSYSERQLYEAALVRLSREISAVQHVTETEAVKEIEAAARQGPAPRTEAG